MSFSVRCDRTGLEYQGGNLLGLFAQRRNLFRPSFYRMLRDILRFNREAPELLDREDESITLDDYLRDNHYSTQFVEHYLAPMGASIWSTPPGKFRQFPARYTVGFFRNHGLLQLRDRPQWKTIVGGAVRYVEALLRPLADRVRLNCPVERVQRRPDHVVVTPRNGEAEVFDSVVLAAHADQSLAMLADPSPAEQEILGAIPYQANEIVLHTDTRLLPRTRRAWASWNYHISDSEEQDRHPDVQSESAAGTSLGRADSGNAQPGHCDRPGEGARPNDLPPSGLQRASDRRPTSLRRDQRAARHVLLRRLLGIRISRGRCPQCPGRGRVLWKVAGIMHSCIYVGRVQHRRFSPAEHRFRYGLNLVYLDLDELPQLLRSGLFLYSSRFSPGSFCRDDHLGDPATPLADAVRELVAAETGDRPEGPIRLLTQLRRYGYYFSPLNLYYCFDRDGEDVEAVVAEVSNTPWLRAALLRALAGQPRGADRSTAISPPQGFPRLAFHGHGLRLPLAVERAGEKRSKCTSPITERSSGCSPPTWSCTAARSPAARSSAPGCGILG